MFPQLGQFASYSVETLAGQSQVSDSVVLKARLKSQIETNFGNLQIHVMYMLGGNVKITWQSL